MLQHSLRNPPDCTCWCSMCVLYAWLVWRICSSCKPAQACVSWGGCYIYKYGCYIYAVSSCEKLHTPHTAWYAACQQAALLVTHARAIHEVLITPHRTMGW